MNKEPKFQNYTCKEDYEKAGIRWCTPMTAKEIESEEEQDRLLKDMSYYVEEKFDGTRGILHFFSDHTRCFSRRVSEKTGWFCENTDSLPHIRDIALPKLDGTIIDGEMFIPGRPFKDVSSTLNCLYDEAIRRQENLGKIVFHAFDILYYQGICVEQYPLRMRKKFLQRVINQVNSHYIKMVEYFDDLVPIPLTPEELSKAQSKSDIYPTLSKERLIIDFEDDSYYTPTRVSKKSYYEYIVMMGGEGVIIKPKEGKYFHKRGREYQKIKKFLTREVIVLGFTPPTKEYKGKYPNPETWNYWEDNEGGLYDTSTQSNLEWVKDNIDEMMPVSKYYFEEWVGNIRFGVIITDEEIQKLTKKKDFKIDTFILGTKKCKVIEVGECSGFDEEMRYYLTSHQHEIVGTTIEVKANEIFKDTGKLRHPRFLRLRPDKSPTECTWHDHINS